jgi:hypothetical protein
MTIEYLYYLIAGVAMVGCFGLGYNAGVTA